MLRAMNAHFCQKLLDSGESRNDGLRVSEPIGSMCWITSRHSGSLTATSLAPSRSGTKWSSGTLRITFRARRVIAGETVQAHYDARGVFLGRHVNQPAATTSAALSSI